MSRNMLDILVILLIISASEELVADFKVIVVLLGAFHVAGILVDDMSHDPFRLKDYWIYVY